MEPPVTGVRSAGTTATRDTMNRIRRVFITSLGLNLEEKDLPYEQKLDEISGLDSLAVLEFVTALEKEFGMAIEPEKLELSFVRDLPRLACYIEERQGRRPGSEA